MCIDITAVQHSALHSTHGLSPTGLRLLPTSASAPPPAARRPLPVSNTLPPSRSQRISTAPLEHGPDTTPSHEQPRHNPALAAEVTRLSAAQRLLRLGPDPGRIPSPLSQTLASPPTSPPSALTPPPPLPPPPACYRSLPPSPAASSNPGL